MAVLKHVHRFSGHPSTKIWHPCLSPQAWAGHREGLDGHNAAGVTGRVRKAMLVPLGTLALPRLQLLLTTLATLRPRRRDHVGRANEDGDAPKACSMLNA